MSWVYDMEYMVTVETFSQLIASQLPEPQAGLLSGILFGTKATIDPLLKDALIATGTLHIIALSGMNITILISIVYKLLLPLFSRKFTNIFTIMIICGFVWFVGPAPSIIRAAIMGILPLTAFYFGRQVWAIWGWCVTCIIMLCVSPSWLFTLSFQLSALASLGIILFGTSLSETSYHTPSNGIKVLQESLMTDLRTTLAAQVFTVPLIFFTFHRLSLISPLTNILIGWTMVPITVFGLLLCVVGIFIPFLAIPFSWILWVFLSFVIQCILWTSRIPMASVGG